jgi:hypothetical protein
VTGCDAAATRGCVCVEKPRARGSYSPGRRTPATTISASSRASTGHRGARIINVSFTGPRDPSSNGERRKRASRSSSDRSCRKWRREISPSLFAPYADVIAVTATGADHKLVPGCQPPNPDCARRPRRGHAVTGIGRGGMVALSSRLSWGYARRSHPGARSRAKGD